MKIIPKILLFILIFLIVIMGMISFFSIKKAQEIVYEQIDHLLVNNLEAVEESILAKIEENKRVATIISRHPVIAKAMDLNVSRGVNRILNEMVINYSFIDYSMVVEPNGDIFAVSTLDNFGHKTKGEQLLGKSIKDHPLFVTPMTHQTTESTPGIDPFLAMINLKEGMNQWFVYPLYKRGNLTGYVVISYAWKREITKLLVKIHQRLTAVGNPIEETILIDEKNDVIAGVALNKEHFVGSSDKVFKQKKIFSGKNSMKIVLSKNKSKLNAPIKQLQYFLFIVMIFGTILMVVGFYYICNRIIICPILNLYEGSKIIASGDLEHQVGTKSQDEIGQLSKAFDDMRLKIKDFYKDYASDLEREVKAKTEEIAKIMSHLEKAKSEAEEKAADLAETNEMFLGREEKLIELKKQIEDLKRKIG